MKVLLLGSGGREHAIAWKLAQSPKLKKLFIAPGNAGTADEGTNVDLNVSDYKAVKEFAAFEQGMSKVKAITGATGEEFYPVPRPPWRGSLSWRHRLRLAGWAWTVPDTSRRRFPR